MIRKEHREEEFEFPFVSYEPDGELKGLPLIIQLHGAGERGCGDLEKMDIHGFSKLFQRKDYPCVTVMPQCPAGSFWTAKIESLKSFIEKMIEFYGSDRNKIYLCGLSMGGFGTWHTAMAYPNMFAAIAPVCGGGMAWNAGVLNMPIRTFHGAKDNDVSISQTEEMVNALKALGRDITYTRMEDMGHNCWIRTFDEELMEWFLSQSRKN